MKVGSTMNLLNLQQPRGSRNNLDDNMIPAINIVFLLLIFFMIAGQIQARSDALQLPVSTSEAELASQEITLQLLADGSYRINGEPTSLPLPQSLETLALDKKTPVICQVHRDLPASALDPILQTARQLGIEQLQIATERQP